MLYIFHGSDISKSLAKARVLVNSLRTKRPDASFIEIEAKAWSPSIIQENIGGQGLFSSKYIIFLNRVTENVEAKESLVDFLEVMHESTNIFVILEAKVNAEFSKAFDKHAEKVVITEEQGANNKGKWASKEEFNIFSLADAVGERNAFKSWSLYREAVEHELEIESIIGTLFWQIKSMISAQDAKTAGESGLSPFVYSKAKRGAANYSRQELRKLMTSLITIYHDSHRGIVDAELAVERVMLDIKLRQE